MLRENKGVRTALVAASLSSTLLSAPATAALPLIERVNSYFHWGSYTDLDALLLFGSIALLMVGVLLKLTHPSKPDQTYALDTTNERFTRRMGTMPIYPPATPDAA